jgi:hypothetical protein
MLCCNAAAATWGFLAPAETMTTTTRNNQRTMSLLRSSSSSSSSSLRKAGKPRPLLYLSSPLLRLHHHAGGSRGNPGEHLFFSSTAMFSLLRGGGGGGGGGGGSTTAFVLPSIMLAVAPPMAVQTTATAYASVLFLTVTNLARLVAPNFMMEVLYNILQPQPSSSGDSSPQDDDDDDNDHVASTTFLRLMGTAGLGVALSLYLTVILEKAEATTAAAMGWGLVPRTIHFWYLLLVESQSRNSKSSFTSLQGEKKDNKALHCEYYSDNMGGRIIAAWTGRKKSSHENGQSLFHHVPGQVQSLVDASPVGWIQVCRL